jgi:hypothetical protein
MFKVGDTVILNDCDRPCGQLVAVVVHDDGEHYHCEYLNADTRFDYYSNPPMRQGRLELATKLEEFGVELRANGDDYQCIQVRESFAKYPDGMPRQWQDTYAVNHKPRKHLAEMLGLA